MAVLNPPQNLPNVAFLIYRYLARQRGRSAAWPVMTSVLAPATVVSDLELSERNTPTGAHPLCVATRQGRDIGLFALDGAKVTLIPEVRPCDTRSEDLVRFRALLRRLVLAPEANPDTPMTGDGDKAPGATDLVRALAWYLMQSIAEAPLTWEDTGQGRGAATLKQQQLRRAVVDAVIRNDTRWGAFTRWSTYLGLAAWQPAGSRIGIIPDPSQALAAVVANLPVVGRAPIRQFLSETAERCPVLDRGRYWQQVADQLVADAPVRLGDDEVSPALGHALLVLRDQGSIQLIDAADASDRLHFRGQGPPDNRFSHVAVVKGSHRP